MSTREDLRASAYRPLIVAGVCLWVCGACARREPAFTATYVTTEEQVGSGERAESRVVVHVDGPRFRIEDERRIDVYDGTTLSTVFRDVSDTGHAMPGEADRVGAADRTVSAVPRTAAEMRPLKFWENRRERKKGPGGVIAGRDTILYEEVLNRPDGEFAVSGWVDAKTGVVLTSVQTVFARQVGSVLVRSGVTCVSIVYGRPAEELFARP